MEYGNYLRITESKCIEETVEIEGDSFTEVSDKVKEYMNKGYTPVIVKRHEHVQGKWIGGATKRTRVE